MRPNTTLADFLRARDSQITFSVTHGWSAFWRGRPFSRTSDWRDELGRWLKPFLDRLGHKARRQMCPLHVSGLDRSWRAQERSADGEAACARRMRSIASLHCG